MPSRARSLLLLLAGCAAPVDPPAPLPDAVAVVSDSGNQRVIYTRLADRSRVLTVNLRALHPDDCGPEYGGAAPDDAECLVFQTDPLVVTDADGTHDELRLTYDRQATDGHYERSAIERIRIGGPTLWRLDALDFATNFGDRADLCGAPTPCGDGSEMAEAPLEAQLRCRLAHVHDFDVVAEDAAGVDLVVADSVNERVLAVHLDPSTTCGVVTDVLADATVPGWSEGRTPNDVDVVPLPDGGSGVLVTFRSSNGDVAAGGVTGGDDGNGLVMLFRRTADADTGASAGWERAWRFPTSGFLNSPHDASLHTSAAGARALVYAHSDGNGVTLQADWHQAAESRGSVGVARVPDDALTGAGAPDYRYDLVLPDTDPDGGFGFLRAVHPFADGVSDEPDPVGTDWIVADSGCMAVEAGCPRVPGVRAVQLDLDDPTDGPGTGAFEPGRGQQTDLTGTSTGLVMNCGLAAPYVADLLWATGARIPEAGPACE